MIKKGVYAATLSVLDENGSLDIDETITEFIDEDRRVKNSEINYFDHPNMGLIIKIDKS